MTDRICVLVLNYNGGRVLDETLQSLSRSEPGGVPCVVVDNQSTDGSFDQLPSDIERIRLDRNRGWAGAYNRAIPGMLARGYEWLWLLNNDVLIEPGCVSALLAFAERNPRCRVLSPIIYFNDPRDRLWFAGGRVERRRFSVGHCSSLDEFRSLPDGERYLSGCALLVHRSVFERIGLFDESFFMYCEDADFGLRAAAAGFSCEVVEDATLYHRVYYASGGLEAGGPFLSYQTFRSLLLFWRKHAGWWRFHRRYCENHLGKWLNPIPAQWAHEQKRAVALAVIDALWDYLTGARDPLRRAQSPLWFQTLVRRYPWVVARLMAFRLPF